MLYECRKKNSYTKSDRERESEIERVKERERKKKGVNCKHKCMVIFKMYEIPVEREQEKYERIYNGTHWPST